jgi:hypothetical protein
VAEASAPMAVVKSFDAVAFTPKALAPDALACAP